MVPILQDAAKFVKNLTDKWFELPQATRDSIVASTAWTAAIFAAIGASSKFLERLTKIARQLKLIEAFKGVGLPQGFRGGGIAGKAGFLGSQLLSLFPDPNDPKQKARMEKAIADAQRRQNMMKGIFNKGAGFVNQGLQSISKPGQAPQIPTFNLGEIVVEAERISSPFQQATETIKSSFSGLRDAIGGILGEILGNAQVVAQGLNIAFTGAFNALGQSIAQSIVFGKDFGETFKNMIKEMAASVISFLVQTIAKVITLRALGVVGPIPANVLFGGGFAEGAMSSPGGKSIGGFFKNLLPFAEGGIVTKPTLGVFGESGPEAIVPLDKLDKMGGNVTVNISGMIMADDSSAVDKFVRKIQDGIIRATKRRTGGVAVSL